MRVITGLARGRRLISPDGEAVRPTADKVKEAIFSSIQFDVEGRQVLDLFAGSGQLGIEAISRGARFAQFVDLSRVSCQLVKKNLALCGFEDKAGIANTEAVSFLSTTRQKYGVVFLDPPYGKGLVERALAYVPDVLEPGGVVVCETAWDEVLPETVGALRLAKNTKYAKTRLYIYRSEDAQP